MKKKLYHFSKRLCVRDKNLRTHLNRLGKIPVKFPIHLSLTYTSIRVEYNYLFWHAFELQLTVFNVVPWLSTVPGIIAGGVLTRRLQSDGYSISYTRKVVEGICMITEAFCFHVLALASAQWPAHLTSKCSNGPHSSRESHIKLQYLLNLQLYCVLVYKTLNGIHYFKNWFKWFEVCSFECWSLRHDWR